MKDLTLAIWNIFRVLGSILAVIRNALFNTLFIIVLIGFAIHYFSSSTPEIPANSTLELTLVGDIVEERRTSSRMESLVNEMLGSDNQPRFMVLQDILDMIETAAFDSRIDTIVLDLSRLGKAGLDQLQEIGDMLDVFRYQNKKVIAAQDFYTQQQYYLASYADTIIVNPMGGVELHGFGSYSLYFKEMLDSLDVNYHIFRVGEYKAAIEPLTRTSMSDEAKSQNIAWLDTLWTKYVHDVAQRRAMKPEDLYSYVSEVDQRLAKVKGDVAQLALSEKLVDLVLTREELSNHLNNSMGVSDNLLISTSTYMKQIEQSYKVEDANTTQIGIIVAEGNIVGGNQPAGLIGSESLAELLRLARKNANVEGVVLRINSPGGSAFAAEVIRQELLELKKAGKPVVISMGSMAASGGYWISADADMIIASKVTLTGSIGIFGAIPTFEKTLANIGVYNDGVGTTPIASSLDITRPLAPEVKKSIQLTVNNGYQRFLDIVSQGRNIDKKQIASVAEGRIFSGERAKELGLVDELGNLTDAIEAVAKLAGLDEYSPVYIQRQQSFKDELLAQLGASESLSLAQVLKAFFPGISRIANQITPFIPSGDPHNIYAHAMVQLPK